MYIRMEKDQNNSLGGLHVVLPDSEFKNIYPQ